MNHIYFNTKSTLIQNSFYSFIFSIRRKRKKYASKCTGDMATTTSAKDYTVPAFHNRGFLFLLFVLAAKLPKASTSTEQGLELLVKLRQQEKRCEE